MKDDLDATCSTIDSLRLALRANDHKGVEECYDVLHKKYLKDMHSGTTDKYQHGKIAGVILMLDELKLSDTYTAQGIMDDVRSHHKGCHVYLFAVLSYVYRNPGVARRFVDKTFNPSDEVYSLLINNGLLTYARPGKEPYLYITSRGEAYLKESLFFDTFVDRKGECK